MRVQTALPSNVSTKLGRPTATRNKILTEMPSTFKLVNLSPNGVSVHNLWSPREEHGGRAQEQVG